MAVEQVSVNILRILGLEATDEVDMKSYKGFLREKLVEISMGKGGLSREDEMAIREEFQRVKGSTATKVKKTTINPQAVFNRQLGAGSGGLVKYKPPAPGSLARRVLPQQKSEESGILDKIYSIVVSIKNALVKEENLRKKAERNRRVKKDKEDKAAKESSLEKAAKGIVGALEKTFKPVVDIFKRIRDALILLFLGWTANRLLDWIQDPKNLKTFNAIVDFLSRNAGKLLLLFVLLNNPLVKVVRWLGRNMISFLVRMIADLAKGKGLLNTLKRGRRGGLLGAGARVLTNPQVMTTAGVLAGAALANEVTGQRQAAGVQVENKARAQSGQGLGVQGVGGVGDLGPTTPYGKFQGTGGVGDSSSTTTYGGLKDIGIMNEQNLDDGGVVKGPSGIDKVPANLTEGEVVFSKPAVKTFGEDFLLAMNKLGGGTNQPTYSGGRMYAVGGGIAISSRRGMRKSPTTGQMKMHQGADITAPTGTPLYAFSAGRIKEIKRVGQGDAGYGNSIYWIDNNGYGHLYAHLDKFVAGLSAGMEIKKGKMMGTVGSTGNSTGPHLHWEMGKNPNDVGRNGPSLIDPLTKYGHMTPFSGKPSPADRLEDPLSPLDQTDQQFANQQSQPPLTFANESDRRLYTAYLNYITQPMGRGLDIRPTIDQVVGVPGSAGPNQSPSSVIPSGSATPGNPQATVAAANRQIASPTR
jgi:murein DD-endopeptidase MepM/ murein hydrolase activator NlpD